MEPKTVPIVVGVTGHRDLRPADVPALEQTVREELKKLQQEYPNSPVWMLNSLAAGGDQLCARVALALGIPLYCPLPKPIEEYCKDFTPEELLEFGSLCASATEIFVAPHTEPEKNDIDYFYRQAGIYVAEHCHVLLALWDGTPGTSNGCGTAEAVGFMLEGNYQDGNAFHFENDGAVIHIATPRASKQQDFPVSVALLEKEKGCLKATLQETDMYNRDVQKKPIQGEYTLLPPEYLQGKISGRLQAVYDGADNLSMHSQKLYLRILEILALFSVVLVVLYLLYDKAALNACLIGYGAFMLLYALFFRRIARGKQQEKYLQYRALAEALRVQLYLHALGQQESICNDFTWTQKHNSTWIKETVSALLIGPKEEQTAPMDVVKQIWIDGQRAYHEKACKRDSVKHRKQELASRVMLVCSVLTWLVDLAMEFFFSKAMMTLWLGLTVSAWLKILWGCLSAATVFVTGYYGKMSLDRKCSDHKKMQSLFTIATHQYEQNPRGRAELFRQLGREELIENGNWVSYCQENSPDFSI